MPAKIDDFGYATAPRKVGLGWYYEDRSGLLVYSGSHNGIMLAWNRVEKALANHKRAVAKKKRKGRPSR